MNVPNRFSLGTWVFTLAGRAISDRRRMSSAYVARLVVQRRRRARNA